MKRKIGNQFNAFMHNLDLKKSVWEMQQNGQLIHGSSNLQFAVENVHGIENELDSVDRMSLFESTLCQYEDDVLPYQSSDSTLKLKFSFTLLCPIVD